MLYEVKLRPVNGSPRRLTLINGLVIADDPAEARTLAVRDCPAGYQVVAVETQPHRSYRHDGEFRHNWRHKN
jgi:hypothetical protein